MEHATSDVGDRHRQSAGEARGKPRDTYSWVSSSSSASGGGLDQDLFLGQLGHLLVALSTQFGVLDGAHGECSGHERGEPGEYEHARADARAANPSQTPAEVRIPSLDSGTSTDPLGDPSGGTRDHQLALEFALSSSD